MDDPKNLTIGLLAVALLMLGGMVLQDRLPGLMQTGRGAAARGEPVAVLDVVLDREGLRTLDFLLDRPVGEGRVGDALGLPAATTQPAVAGTWRWEGANVLRFEPAGGFAMAMQYDFDLLGERIMPPGRYLAGESSFEVTTDQFQVERVDTFQEPTPEGDAIVIRGTARFNYEVDPEQLATQMRLVDPQRGATEPVPLVFETYWAERLIGFRSEPLVKEREARDLSLSIARALTPAAGNVPLTSDFETSITLGSSETLAVWDVTPIPGDPESRMRLRLSSPVDAAVMERFVSVTPEVPFRLSAQRNELVLTGAFRPGDTYTVSLAAGAPGIDDAILRDAYSATLPLPDLEPRLDFQSQGMFLAASGNRALAIEAVNTDFGDLAIERVYRNNLFYLFSSYSWMVWDSEPYSGSAVAHALGDRVAEVTLPTGGQSNRTHEIGVDLTSYLDRGDPGLYRLVLSRRGDYLARQRWVLVSDLGIVAKRGEQQLLVWVSSVQSLQPVAGARITVISDQNQPIMSGRTDGRGLWRASPPAGFEAQRPYMVVVERGNDFSFLLFDGMGIDTTGLDVGGAASSAVGYQAFLYGERDVYRPGEQVEGIAVVRDAALRAPPRMPLLLRHLDPTGLERSTRRVDLERGGVAPFELAVPAYARTGNHTLELVAGERAIGRYRFQVEEFVPDRIRVGISAGDHAPGPGESLAFEVDSAYLFGPPAGGLAVEARVALEAETFAPAGYDEYAFSYGERSFPAREVFETEGELDASGRISIRAEVPTGMRPPSSLAAVVTARVQESGGRGVAARQRVPIHPYPYYLGLRRAGSGYADPGTPESFELVALTPAGQPVAAGALVAELYRDEWQTVLRRTPSGAFRYESTRDARLVDSLSLDAGSSAATFALTPEELGAYRVVLSDPLAGPAAEVAFTASGSGFSPWAIDNPARIELELDRDEYAPGETATVQVRAPFGGRLLLTVERNGLQAVQVHELEGNTATLRIPVAEAMRPNAYVTATVVRGVGELEPGGVARAFGAVPIAVDRAANRMPVSVAHVEQMRPRSELSVTVDAVPGAALTVAAVDEGVLQLINQTTPDPFEFFYRKLALGVGSFDTFSLLFPEVSLAADTAVGGGAMAAMMDQFVRTEGIRRVRPVALWSGLVRADPAGRAQVSFDVPDFQGALRVMAVAYQGRRFGSAQSFVTVRDPLVVMPTLPRFLSLQERLQVPVTVRNDTGSEGEVSVELRSELPGQAAASTTQQVRVADGGEAVLYFDVATGATTGEASFAFIASGMGESTRAAATLPLRADLPSLARERLGQVEEPTTVLAAAADADLRPGAQRTLRVSRAPTLQLNGRLEALLRYPYGCLEQVTSTAFPLVYLGELASELDPGLFQDSVTPAVMVQEAIRRVGTFQTYSGGFGLWPDSDTLQPWASVYATHFLVESRRAGFLVPDALYDGALQFARQEARARTEYAWDELQRVAYALYVLARAGDPDLGTMDFLRQRHLQGMRAETRALLGAAYAAVGNTPAVEDMIIGLQQVEELERQTGGNFNSPVRNRALVLLALLDAAPDDDRIPEVARRLAREVTDPAPWSTQESAFALLALGQYFDRQADRGEYLGRVFVDDQEVAVFDSSAPLVTALPDAGDVRIEMDAGYEAGAAYYALTTRGVPTDGAYTPIQDGLQIRRVFLDRNGRPFDLDAVGQGDLIVVRMQVQSTSGPLENVVVQNLLPAGFEVENPRLANTETLPWIGDADLVPDHIDLRDDQILLFASLPDSEWRTAYALVRAVAPGDFRLPPIQAEAMYEPAIRATGDRGRVTVRRR